MSRVFTGSFTAPTRPIGRGSRPVNPMLGNIPGEQTEFVGSINPYGGIGFGGVYGKNFGTNGALNAIASGGNIRPGSGSVGFGGASAGVGGGVAGASGGVAQGVQNQLDKANAANEERYRILMLDADKTHDAQMGAFNDAWAKVQSLVGKTGVEPQLARLKEQRNKELASTAQYAATHGLSNSTIAPAMAGEVNRQADLNEAEILDRGRQAEMEAYFRYMGMAPDLMQRLWQNKSGIMERRTDQQPNLGLYANVLSQPGSTGGGYSGSYGGGAPMSLGQDLFSQFFSGSIGGDLGGVGSDRREAAMDQYNARSGKWSYTPSRPTRTYADAQTFGPTQPLFPDPFADQLLGYGAR